MFSYLPGDVENENRFNKSRNHFVNNWIIFVGSTVILFDVNTRFRNSQYRCSLYFYSSCLYHFWNCVIYPWYEKIVTKSKGRGKKMVLGVRRRVKRRTMRREERKERRKERRTERKERK